MLGQGTLPSKEDILTGYFPAVDQASRIPQLLALPLLYVPPKKILRMASASPLSPFFSKVWR